VFSKSRGVGLRHLYFIAYWAAPPSIFLLIEINQKKKTGLEQRKRHSNAENELSM
jgi:hypothetical protein